MRLFMRVFVVTSISIIGVVLFPTSGFASCPGECDTECSPIVINFEKGDYRLTGADSGVWFDIGATGTPRRIGWTAAHADEAFLWLDRNGNGKVDNGAELFGSATLLKNGTKAGNGFVALAQLDDNHDGLIDERDSIWPQLQLWRDLNHDGTSQPGEITLVSDSTVTAIAVQYHWTGRRDEFGNTFRYQSEVWTQNANDRSTPHRLYDVFFAQLR